MKEQDNFQLFLISRFLVILIMVVMFEYLAKFMMDWVLIPAMQQWTFHDFNWKGSLTITEFFIFILLVLGELLLAKIRSFLHFIADSWIESLMEGLQIWGIEMIPALRENPEALRMEALETTVLIFLLIIAIILFVGPLVVAALWFSKIVVDEVRRMEEHKEEMRQVYKKKRNLLLSDIAHDLRTPITTIAGYSKALNDGMITSEEKRREYLEAIENKSERINELINLLFEYVKLDSENFSLNLEIVNLPELLRENAALLYSDAEEKGMKFHIRIQEEPCMVKLDSLQFSRVITNLITNAIRHNEPETVITLEMKQEEDKIVVLVSDNGTLISGFLAEHIFEPFAIGDASRKSKNGSGLGLSIAKKIVEMHGWTLELQQNLEEHKKSFVIEIITFRN